MSLNTADASTVAYFQNIEKLFSDACAGKAEAGMVDVDLLLNNALTEFASQPVKVALDKRCSKVLERLIPRMSAQHLTQLLEPWTDKFMTAACHANGSHVLESLLAAVSVVMADAGDVDQAHITEHLVPLLATIGETVLTNVDDLCVDLYGCHVLSSLLRVLNGKVLEKRTGAGDAASAGSRLFQPPDPWLACWQRFLDYFLVCPPGVYAESTVHGQCVYVLCTFLEITGNIRPDQDTWNRLVDKFLLRDFKSDQQQQQQPSSDNNNSNDLSLQHGTSLMQHRSGSHLWETILRTAPASRFRSLYRSPLFQGRLASLVDHSVGNFVVQALLAAVPDAELATDLFQELEPLLPELLATTERGQHRPGVLLHLTLMCATFNVHEQQILDTLFDAFARNKDYEQIGDQHRRQQLRWADLVEGLLHYGSSNKLEYSNAGCRLLNALMQFSPTEANRCGRVLLDQLARRNRLVELTCHRAGSRVMDALAALTSGGSSSSDRDGSAAGPPPSLQFLSMLLQRPADLERVAADKFGSHVLDKLFANGSLDVKRQLVTALSQRPLLSRLSSSFYGRAVLTNCQVPLFVKSPDQWSQSFRREEQFSDFLSGQPQPQTKGEKRKSELLSAVDDEKSAKKSKKEEKKKKKKKKQQK